MIPPPSTVRRHFLPWDGPLLPQVIAWLTAEWDRGGALDLSRFWVFVPTRQAGRRLREALADCASRAGWAVFPPRVTTPEGILESSSAPVATRMQSLLAWSAVLEAIDLDRFRELFPVDPPARNFSWSLRLADQMIGLAETLAEIGWRMQQVGNATDGGGWPEPGRWRLLAELENRYDQQLERQGLADPQAVRIAAASRPVPPTGIERVVLAAAPDPVPLALRALAGLAGQVPIDVLVFAPPEEAGAFDEWGRPVASCWRERSLTLSDFGESVRLEADPAAQAGRVADLVAAYGPREGAVAIGVVDPEVLPPLERALARAGRTTFNPDGHPRKHVSFFQLLTLLAELAREPSFPVVEALGRHPDLLAFAQHRAGSGFSPARWLAGLDRLRAEHLPGDLEAAWRHVPAGPEGADLRIGLEAIADLLAAVAGPDFARGISAALGALFASRRLQPDRPADAEFAEAASAWMDIVDACADARLEPEAGWELALRLFGDQRRTEERPPDAVDLLGWMELLWEDAPHAVLAGFNDGYVPEAIAGDPFLPESLRVRLGLRTNESRLARDAYLAQALARSRAHGGRLDVLFGKVSSVGDPLRPSRLLFLCPDAELPGRVETLFRGVPAAEAGAAWTRPWRLVPPPIGGHGAAPDERTVGLPVRLGVTALRRWLECPFRFYLHEVLKMEAVDASKAELDASDFGTLCHAALEAMGRAEALRECTDPTVLRDCLFAELDRQVRGRFGDALTLPLMIQVESARQRLRRVAEVQALEQAAGWRIEAVERKIVFAFAGLDLVARIDRIDRHKETGAVRVLDYKTADGGDGPFDAHLRRPRADERLPAWAQCEWEGRVWVWRDLQLPLYRHALAAEFPDLAGCGYFNLPKAAGEGGLAWWEPYPAELHASALACAEGVCQAIRAGAFWPPNERIRPEQDDFAGLFQRGAADSVAWPGRSTS